MNPIDLKKLESIVGDYATNPVATIIEDVPDTVYHGGPGISNSGLNILAKSPAHFAEEKRRRLEQIERKSSKAFDLGTALHCAILEPNKITEVVAFREKVDNRTKYGKEYNEVWASENPGKIGVNEQELDNLKFCVDAVHAHPIARELLKKGKPEQSAYWTWNVDIYEETACPILCRGRIDWLTDEGVIVDLKTTADADLDEWKKSVTNYGYHRQQAWYQGGLQQILGAPSDFYFIVVENKAPPFGVRVIKLDQAAIEIAREELLSYLFLYAKCLKNDDWPCYGQHVEQISVPHWYKARKAII